MAHLGDTDLSEKGRVILLTAVTSGVVVLTSLVLHAAEALWVFVAMDEQSTSVRAGLHIALWGSFMLLLSRIRLILRAVKAGSSAGVRMLITLPLLLIRFASQTLVFGCRLVLGIVPALLRLVLGGGYDLIAMRVRIWCDPAFQIRDELMRRIAPAIARLRAWQSAFAQERALRRAYRAEFKGHYSSYRAFRAAFDAKGAEQGGAVPAADPFQAACAALGLREDGAFSQDEFKARYRAAMKENHPDIAGANGRAAAINAAAATIRKRKDWK